MKFKYIPGLRPVPMLAYYNEPNIKLFDDLNIGFNLNFNNNNKHYWNHNAYLIIDETNNLITHAIFNNFSYLIFLLRVINKDVIFEINNDMYESIKNDIDELISNNEIMIIN